MAVTDLKAGLDSTNLTQASSANQDKDMVHKCAISYLNTRNTHPRDLCPNGAHYCNYKAYIWDQGLEKPAKSGPENKKLCNYRLLSPSFFSIAVYLFDLGYLSFQVFCFVLFLLDFLPNPFLEAAQAVLAECRSW